MMSYSKYLFLVSVALASVSGIRAQSGTPTYAKENRSFSVKEAVAYALQNNITMSSARIDEELAKRKVDETVAIGLPQISANVNYTNNVQIPVQRLPNFINDALPPGSPKGPDFIDAQFGLAHSFGASARLDQLIADGTYFLGLQAAKDYVRLSTYAKEKTQIDIEMNVVKAYFQVLLGTQQVKVLSNNFSSVDSTLRTTKALNQQGLAEKIDVSRLELSLANLKLQRSRAEDQLKLATNMLKIQLGMNSTSEITLTDKLEDFESKFQLMEVNGNGDINNRAEYKLLKQQERLGQLDMKRYKMGYLPSLSGFVSHQQNSFAAKGEFSTLFNTFFPGTIWGLNLNIPIFKGFGQSARVKQAELNLEKNRLMNKQFEQSFFLEVDNARNTYLRAYENYLQQKENVKLATEVERISKVKMQEGLSTSLEYVTAITDSNNAKVNQVISMYDLLVAEMEYKRVTGQKAVNY